MGGGTLPMVIVHRGGEGSAPENTLAAFEDTARCAAASAARSEAALLATKKVVNVCVRVTPKCTG